MPKKQVRKRKLNINAFTLIELMVAISILAILSVIGLSSYKNAQIAARDSRRIYDVRQIQTAVELYHQVYGRYPCTKGNNANDSITPQNSGATDPDWMNLSSYGAQPYWLKDSGCGGLTVVGGIYVNGKLVGVNPGGSISVTDPTTIKPFDQSVASSLPIDPLINNSPTNPSPVRGKPYMDLGDANSYGYSYFAPDPNFNVEYNNHRVPVGQTYVIYAKLESANNPDSCQNKHYLSCEGYDICSRFPKLFVVVGGC